ncbi:MAG: hypothetical protein WC823_00095 [Parcubacteria group bacterium]|jgi:hypothetical protein
MAYEKQVNIHQFEKVDFSIDNPVDLVVVKNFEQELTPYFAKELNVFGKIIKGFDIYLHEKGMLRYSVKYPGGAVVFSNLNNFEMAQMKYQALRKLWDRRAAAREREEERVQTLIPALAN